MSLILPFHRQTGPAVCAQPTPSVTLIHASAQIISRVLFPSHVFCMDNQQDDGLAQAERIYGETLCFLHSLKD